MDNATLTRFFAFHFIVPFIVAAMACVHIFFFKAVALQLIDFYEKSALS